MLNINWARNTWRKAPEAVKLAIRGAASPEHFEIFEHAWSDRPFSTVFALRSTVYFHGG